jgi:hypothetical protein
MDNRVEIIVGAKDDTKFDLDALKARLAELGRKVETARVKLDGDVKMEATIARMQASLISLGRRTASPKIEVGGAARAYAQMLLMEHELNKLGGTSASGGLLSGVAGAFSSMFALLPAGGVAMAVLAAATVALGVALAPIIAALIPVTLGLGAFAAAIAVLPGVQKKASSDMGVLKDQFHKLAEAVKPELLKAFATGMKIIQELMPALRPLMVAAGKAVDEFLHQLLDWLKSPSGQAFIHWLKSEGPHDIKVFGQVMWDLAKAVGLALDAIYRSGKWLDGHLKDLFTVDIPAFLDILKEKWRIVFDQLQIDTLGAVRGVLEAMSHIPFIGHYFKTAADAVSKEMSRMQGDVRQATGNIQNDLARIHGHSVAINIGLDLPQGVSAHDITGIHGHLAGGAAGAAQGWSVVGEQGPELVRMRGGETVLPASKTRALMGYAAGTLDSFSVHVPSAGQIGGILRIQGLVDAVGSLIQKTAHLTAHFAGGFGGGFSGHFGSGVQQWAGLVSRALSMEGLSPMLLGRVLFQMQTESGGNPNAINLGDINARMGDPSRGLMQTIGSTFAAYHWPGTSWNIFNPFANIAAALNYARHVYGPSLMSGGMGIGSGHGYDHGGFLPTGWSMAYNGTGKPEPVGMAQHIVLEVVGNSSDPLVKWLKEQVRVRGGGNVQAAFGARGR